MLKQNWVYFMLIFVLENFLNKFQDGLLFISRLSFSNFMNFPSPLVDQSISQTFLFFHIRYVNAIKFVGTFSPNLICETSTFFLARNVLMCVQLIQKRLGYVHYIMHFADVEVTKSMKVFSICSNFQNIEINHNFCAILKRFRSFRDHSSTTSSSF